MESNDKKGGEKYSADVMETSVARDSLSDTLNRVSYSKERIVIRRHGKERAARLVYRSSPVAVQERITDPFIDPGITPRSSTGSGGIVSFSCCAS